MERLMQALRQALGIEPTPTPPVDYTSIEARLRDQEARLKAMDAQVDAQRTSEHILNPRRRATDRRW